MKLTKNQKWILGGALVLGAIILYRRNQRNKEQQSGFTRGWSSTSRAGLHSTSCASVGLGNNLPECEKQCDHAGGTYENGYCNDYSGTFGGGDVLITKGG